MDSVVAILTNRETMGAERARRERVRRKHRLYAGDAMTELESQIAESYQSPTTRQHLHAVATVSGNLMRNLPSELARVYNQPPTRRIGIDAQVYDAAWKKILPGGGINGLMLDAHRACVVLGKVGIYLAGDRRENLRARILWPHDTIVAADEFGEPIEVAMRFADPTPERSASLWHVWSDTAQRIIGDDGTDYSRQYPDVMVDGGANPWGRIPIVFVELRRSNGAFWEAEHDSDALFYDSRLRMLAATNLQHQVKWGAFRQLHVSGEVKGEKLAQFLRDSSVALVTEEGATVNVIDTTANIDGMLLHLNGMHEAARASYGLQPRERTSAVQTGFARLIGMQDVIEMNEAQKPLLAEAESALAELVRAMVEVTAFRNVGPLPEGEFTIEYPPFAPMQTSDERQRGGVIDALTGRKTWAQVWGMGEDDAIKMVTRTREYNAQIEAQWPVRVVVSPGATLMGVEYSASKQAQYPNTAKDGASQSGRPPGNARGPVAPDPLPGESADAADPEQSI